MISDILKKLKSRKAPTSQELEAAIAAIDLDAAGERVRAAESVRRAALLDGADDATLARLEGATATARRDQERAEVALGALRARLAETIEREARAALDAARDEAEREASAVAAVLRAEWPDAQRRLLDLLARLAAAESKVSVVNARLAEAGRDDLVKNVEFGRARPVPQFVLEAAVALRTTVVLPAVPEWNVEGHGVVAMPAAFWAGGAPAAPPAEPRPHAIGSGVVWS
ncbi:hypothetical protein MWN33_02235 [Starkeya koreensis]|uniref:Uncharacterized protein n=1 Tax=Ancylobacter koreensis TaxID=266121 RepID=A0ABT0DHT4_9HYPH|nr:hypothetical protein [Ancylobacter koreensis]MCK0206845.1 hypothetical protein [Ancylobacter koreensis]